jgi:hypothetical protein
VTLGLLMTTLPVISNPISKGDAVVWMLYCVIIGVVVQVRESLTDDLIVNVPAPYAQTDTMYG